MFFKLLLSRYTYSSIIRYRMFVFTELYLLYKILVSQIYYNYNPINTFISHCIQNFYWKHPKKTSFQSSNKSYLNSRSISHDRKIYIHKNLQEPRKKKSQRCKKKWKKPYKFHNLPKTGFFRSLDPIQWPSLWFNAIEPIFINRINYL